MVLLSTGTLRFRHWLTIWNFSWQRPYPWLVELNEWEAINICIFSNIMQIHFWHDFHLLLHNFIYFRRYSKLFSYPSIEITLDNFLLTCYNSFHSTLGAVHCGNIHAITRSSWLNNRYYILSFLILKRFIYKGHSALCGYSMIISPAL